MRSLITLKALTYEPTGGIVAAATTSLPETSGGVRNWDYRYCWLRDATQTLEALMRCGCRGEALAWRDWLLRAAAGDPAELQIMYGPRGERRRSRSGGRRGPRDHRPLVARGDDLDEQRDDRGEGGEAEEASEDRDHARREVHAARGAHGLGVARNAVAEAQAVRRAAGGARGRRAGL